MVSERRILTTHVGSLVCPPELLAVLERQYAQQAVSESELDDVLTRLMEIQ
jgi:hypothetical protein